MTTYVIAQLTGLIGYLFLTSAPNFKNQKHIIQMDVLACVFLCLQWALLEHPALLVLNVLNILVSLFVLKIKQQNIIRKIEPIFYPIGCIALLLVSQGSAIDTMCIIAFCSIVRAKSSRDLFTFRYFSIFTGLAFVICGMIAMSIPAIIFNATFVFLHIRKIKESSWFLFKIPLQG